MNIIYAILQLLKLGRAITLYSNNDTYHTFTFGHSRIVYVHPIFHIGQAILNNDGTVDPSSDACYIKHWEQSNITLNYLFPLSTLFCIALAAIAFWTLVSISTAIDRKIEIINCLKQYTTPVEIICPNDHYTGVTKNNKQFTLDDGRTLSHLSEQCTVIETGPKFFPEDTSPFCKQLETK